MAGDSQDGSKMRTELDWRTLDFKTSLQITCKAILDFLPNRGKSLPPEVIPHLKQLNDGTITAEDTVRLYNLLAAMVAPAEPEAITLIYRAKRKSTLRRLLAYKSASALLFISILCLIAFVLLGASPYVNLETLDASFLSRKGSEQWANSAFLLAAAALGAAFEGLFRSYGFIVSRTYDSSYDSSYWIRFTMGIFSGFLLADILYETLPLGDFEYGKPVIAIIGGYSAEVVQKILRRMADAMESLFRDDIRTRVAQHTMKVEAELQQRQQEINKRAISDLIELRESVGGNLDDGSKKAINDTIQKILANWRS